MFLQNEAATLDLGKRIASMLPESFVLYLRGDLGAGKTCLARGLIQGLGHQGRVKSPTYTIVEPYDIAGRRIYHLDLYRLGDAQELEYLGIRDMSQETAVILVEWPERGMASLPVADLEIHLKHPSSQDAEGREAEFLSCSEQGESLLQRLQAG